MNKGFIRTHKIKQLDNKKLKNRYINYRIATDTNDNKTVVLVNKSVALVNKSIGLANKSIGLANKSKQFKVGGLDKTEEGLSC